LTGNPKSKSSGNTKKKNRSSMQVNSDDESSDNSKSTNASGKKDEGDKWLDEKIQELKNDHAKVDVIMGDEGAHKKRGASSLMAAVSGGKNAAAAFASSLTGKK
jgi:hypothetical protein